MKSPALKAGLIGAAVLLLVNLLGLIPLLSCLTLPLELAAYIAVGVLAAFWMAPRRTSGPAAGQGALAGLIAGAVGGLIRAVLTPVSMALAGGSQVFLNQLPPESLQALQQAGLDPNTVFSGGTFAGIALLCCLPASLLLGAGLGALGGAIFAAARPE